MDTYADDLAALVETLDLKDAIHVGHSTGGGEVARYIGRHGTKRVAKAVLISAVPPLMLKTAANPGGLPIEVFDRSAPASSPTARSSSRTSARRSTAPTGRARTVSQGLRDSFWLQGMLAGFKGVFDCIKAFSETDFTEDLKKFDVPTLILHGDDDQIVPIGAAALLSSKLVKDARLVVYQGAPHGMCSTLKDRVNQELLEFFKEAPAGASAPRAGGERRRPALMPRSSHLSEAKPNRSFASLRIVARAAGSGQTCDYGGYGRA